MFKRLKKVAEIALELSEGELDIGVDQKLPPVALRPGASPAEEIDGLADHANRSREIAAAAPAVKVRVEALEPAGVLARTPLARLNGGPAIPLIGGVDVGDKVSLHVLGDGMAFAAGAPARAIVQSSEGVPARESVGWAPTSRTSVRLELRPRLPGGSFGRRSEHNPLVTRQIGVLLTTGEEIPVLLDYATGEVAGIDKQALAKEWAHRADEAKARDDEAHRTPGLAEVKRAIADGFRPGDTVEGVSAENWLLARTVLKRPMPAAQRETLLKAYKVPPGRWEAVDAAWTARAEADPGLADRLARAIR